MPNPPPLPQPGDYSSSLSIANSWSRLGPDGFRRATETGSTLSLNPFQVITDPCGRNAYKTLSRDMTIMVVKDCKKIRWGSISMTVTIPLLGGERDMNSLLNTNIRLQPTTQVTTFLDAFRRTFNP